MDFDCSFAYRTLIPEVSRMDTVEVLFRFPFRWAWPSALCSAVVVHIQVAVDTVVLLSFPFISSTSTSSTTLLMTTTATAAATPPMCKEAICFWGRGYGEVAFVRIVLLPYDYDPPDCCVDVGTRAILLRGLGSFLSLPKMRLRKIRRPLANSVPVSCCRKELRRVI